MLNDAKEWQRRFPEFLLEAETLLAKSEDCLSHLQLILNDRDAIECLQDTLLKLAGAADALALSVIAPFCRQIHALLSRDPRHQELAEPALLALHDCLTLLAWQLELIDARTGKLALDDNEQTALLDVLARHLGLAPPPPAYQAKPLAVATFAQGPA